MSRFKLSAIGSVLKGGIAPIFWIYVICITIWNSKLYADFGYPNKDFAPNGKYSDEEPFYWNDGRLSISCMGKVLSQQFLIFEIEIFKSWIIGGAVIVAFLSMFRFKSAWQEDEEKYELHESMWKTKDT